MKTYILPNNMEIKEDEIVRDYDRCQSIYYNADLKIYSEISGIIGTKAKLLIKNDGTRIILDIQKELVCKEYKTKSSSDSKGLNYEDKQLLRNCFYQSFKLSTSFLVDSVLTYFWMSGKITLEKKWRLGRLFEKCQERKIVSFGGHSYRFVLRTEIK